MYGLKKTTFILSAGLIALALTSCSGKSQSLPVPDENSDYTACLYKEFNDFKGEYPKLSNSALEYYEVCGVPEGRTVELCYVNIADSSDTIAVRINPEGVEVSDVELGASLFGYYPVDTVKEMLSVDETEGIPEHIGTQRPYRYTEYKGTSALLLKDSLVFGTADNYRTVSLDNSVDEARVHSMQITEDCIYLFELIWRDRKSSLAVTSVTLAEEPEQSYTLIPFADIGISEFEFKGKIEDGNTFIHNGILYLSVDNYSGTHWVGAYNLETNKGANVEIRGYEGKIFCYDGNIGITTAKANSTGYGTDMSIRFYKFDTEKSELIENNELYIEYPKDAKHIFGLDGNKFYCIGDKLCGVMYNTSTGFAYAEIDLKTGKVTSMIPFRQTLKYHTLVGYTVLSNGVCVSQHNCDV